jgi:signal transduction histidine kinase
MTFHKTSLKLATLYLAILVVISLFFSATIYQASVSELQHSLRRPLPVFDGPGFPSDVRDQLIEQRLQSYDQAQDRIVTRLIITNLFILAFGGCLSYYLALRTLKPIEDAHEAQRLFAANASHELRTPITAMRSETEVSLMNPKLTLSDAKNQLQSNIEELEKLTNLAESLLRLAQAEGANDAMEEVFISAIVATATARLQSAAQSHNVTISTDKIGKVKAYGNSTALTEIVAVLLDNAIKYSPSQGKVTITAEEDESVVTVHVTDQGPGISPDQVPHIFDRFYRADASRTKQSATGYGLGLAIASELAKKINARLTVYSTVDSGSTFTLSIPKTA